jgi:hypothetical protein
VDNGEERGNRPEDDEAAAEFVADSRTVRIGHRRYWTFGVGG